MPGNKTFQISPPPTNSLQIKNTKRWFFSQQKYISILMTVLQHGFDSCIGDAGDVGDDDDNADDPVRTSNVFQ